MRHAFFAHTITALAAPALAFAALPPVSAQDSSAVSAPPPPNYKIQYNGLIDGYLQYSTQNPRGNMLDSGIASGAYNTRVKTPTLQLAELNVFSTPRPHGFGFKTTLIAGDAANQNHANFNYATGATISSGGEAQFKNIQQLYGTYAFAGSGGGVDLGKFYTPFGYEVTEANADYNYTRSLAYNILPIYHAGLRVYAPSWKGLVATGWLVNDLYNTATEGVHHQGGYGTIGQLNYTDPKGKYTAITTLGFGSDVLGGIKTRDVVSDTDFTYNLNSERLIGLNYDYAHFKPSDGSARTTQYGFAAYYRQSLTPKTALAARFSGNSTRTDGSDDIKPTEVTLTYEYKAAPNFTMRVEYRHDHNNVDSYLGHNDPVGEDAAPGHKSQDLLILAGMFTF